MPHSLASTTADLLERARAGDTGARDALIERHLPLIKRWAHGRLPRWARDITDTSDLVHETLLDTLKHLDTFEPRGAGALQAYLRQAVMNRVRNQLRRRAVRGAATTMDSQLSAGQPSPFDLASAQLTLERYEAALTQLRPEERELVVQRVELGVSYPELAILLGKPSPDAARMAVVRALIRLAELMHHE